MSRFLIPQVLFYHFCLTSCVGLNREESASSDDYLISTENLRKGDAGEALASYHKKEKDGFISTVEKSWLKVLGGKPALDDGALKRTVQQLEGRQTLSVSTTAKTFFYKESEDGYFPAEHEAIILHLITATAFAQNNQIKEMLVETRKAEYYLEAQYAPHLKSPFDDAALRLWAGSLLAYGGDWANARVDFKVAAKLSKNIKLKQLAKLKNPPQYIGLAFLGIGPEAYADPHDSNGIQFKDSAVEIYSHRKLALWYGREVLTPVADVNSYYWYLRHQERDRQIEKVIKESRYGLRTAAYRTKAGSTYALGMFGAGLLIGSSFVLGGGLLAYGGYLAFVKHVEPLGILVGVSGIPIGLKLWNLGFELKKNTVEERDEILEMQKDYAKFYRYVRFLPERFLLFWSQKNPSKEEIMLVDANQSYHKPLFTGDNGKNYRLDLFFVSRVKN